MGLYLAAVFDGRRTWLSPVLAPLERGFYRLGGVKQDDEQDWKGYAASLVLTETSGTVSPTTIYARLKANAPVTTYNNISITVSGGGASSQSISTTASGNTVTPKAQRERSKYSTKSREASRVATIWPRKVLNS